MGLDWNRAHPLTAKARAIAKRTDREPSSARSSHQRRVASKVIPRCRCRRTRCEPRTARGPLYRCGPWLVIRGPRPEAKADTPSQSLVAMELILFESCLYALEQSTA